MKNPFASFVEFIDLSNRLYIHYPGPRWAVVGGYLLTIYLTLPLTPIVARASFKLMGKRETGLVISAGLILALLASLTIVFLRIGKGRRLLAALPFVAILALAATTVDNPVERVHFLEYGLLAYLVFRAAGKPRGRGLAWVYCAVVVAGFSDELIQGMLPNRFFDLHDVAMNAVGSAIGLWFGVMTRRPEHDLERSQRPLVRDDPHRL
ncbi:MAG: VanZ family protein [Magnetococcales bacterium]|nr:VanZ family protein [Magnetococcales bacterium]